VRSISADDCNSIRKLNSLDGQRLPAKDLRLGDKQYGRLRHATITDIIVEGERDPREVNLGGLAAGTYALTATFGAHADSLRYATVCFVVSEQNLQTFFNFSGFQQWRGKYIKTNPRSDQLTFVRVVGGVRYITARDFFEFGPEVGYERLGYEAAGPVSWDGPTSVTTSVKWTRHGTLLGGFFGARFPISRCAWTPKKTVRECGVFGASTLAFLNFHLLANVGVLDLRNVPNTSGTEVLDIDMDVGGFAGVRGKPRRHVTVGVFGGLLLTDVTRLGNLRQAASYAYDWSIRFVVGLEVGWGGDTRKRS
jgi:hypothetical protein